MFGMSLSTLTALLVADVRDEALGRVVRTQERTLIRGAFALRLAEFRLLLRGVGVLDGSRDRRG